MGNALIAMKFKKRAPKPDLEGPPEREESMGAGRDEPGLDVEEQDDAAPESGEMEGSHDDHAAMALDELADIAGISPEDRPDFHAALTAFVHASIAKVMSEQDAPEEPGEGGEEPEEEPAPEEE